MDAGQAISLLLAIALIAIRGLFFVGLIAAVVAVIRAVWQAASSGGSATPGTAYAPGRPTVED